MLDLTKIREKLESNQISEELLENNSFKSLPVIYNDPDTIIKNLNEINKENKLTNDDINMILKSRYPGYISYLVMESKKRKFNSKIITKLSSIINNCEKNYQAFGTILTITQIDSVKNKDLIKACEIISKTDSIKKIKYVWLTLTFPTLAFIGEEKRFELADIISNSISDENAEYAYKVSLNKIINCKDPILRTLQASQVLRVPKISKETQPKMKTRIKKNNKKFTDNLS